MRIKVFLSIVFNPVWKWFIGGILNLVGVVVFFVPDWQPFFTWPAISKIFPWYLWVIIGTVLWALLTVGEAVMRLEEARNSIKGWDKNLKSHDQTSFSLQNSVSGYRKRYLEYMVYQHRVFDVKGLTTQGPYSLELQKVYVELSIDPTPLHKVQSNPIHKLPEELRVGSHAIWDFFSGKNVQGNHYAILGAPGSGKTTLLKHMALTLATREHQRRRGHIPNLLPILLFIRDHATSIRDNPKISLPELIRNQFADRHAPLPPIGWLETIIEQGKCLIMLDGLDEIADISTRRLVVDWVDQCMASYGKNRFVITSRPFGYRSNPLSNVTLLQIQPFTKKQQEQFIYNWYLANEVMSFQRDDPGVREEARRGAADLVKRISLTETLAQLAVNPLLLTMIATVHRYRSSLPGRRVELYAEICEVFLGKRRQTHGVEEDLTPGQKTTVLSQLACYMMVHKIREIDEADALRVIEKPLASVNPDGDGKTFLKAVENTSGLILELETGKYCFSHLTFQEYLAANFIIAHRLEKLLIQNANDPWWRETILLYCAQTDASNIISACLNSSDVAALSLAIECVDEARSVKPDIRTQFLKTIEGGLEDPNPEKSKLIAAALLKHRTR